MVLVVYACLLGLGITKMARLLLDRCLNPDLISLRDLPLPTELVALAKIFYHFWKMLLRLLAGLYLCLGSFPAYSFQEFLFKLSITWLHMCSWELVRWMLWNMRWRLHMQVLVITKFVEDVHYSALLVGLLCILIHSLCL